MLSLDAYLPQEVEVQKMDEELGKEVHTLLALLVQKYEYWRIAEQVTVTEMEYKYEAEMEDVYKARYACCSTYS